MPLLALFFVSAMEFMRERALIDLVLMTGAFTILLWGEMGKSRHIHTTSTKKRRQYHSAATKSCNSQPRSRS
jgi:hypothetical protein